MSLGHQNRNIHALHKSIAFLQNELTEKNIIIKSPMEAQTAVIDVMRISHNNRILQNRT